MPPSDATELLLQAVSFAARAHRHQLRKDRDTPYIAHAFRVALIARQEFGIDNPWVLAAAVLHDTIEDTPTDRDDLSERFGDEIAGWVAQLTKDMRLPEPEREDAYRSVLASASWPVVAVKLADLFDNLADSPALPPDSRRKTLARIASYLDAMRSNLTPETRVAFEIVSRRIDDARRDTGRD